MFSPKFMFWSNAIMALVNLYFFGLNSNPINGVVAVLNLFCAGFMAKEAFND